MPKASPSYEGLRPASENASKAARGASRKSDTRPERLLRSLLWHRGLRFRKNVKKLPGRPDIVFSAARVAVFCDGDFWHGKEWPSRRRKLWRGTNADYWIAKIERNMERDATNTERLRVDGWHVMRFWESDIARDGYRVTDLVEAAVRQGQTSARSRS